MGGAQYFLPLGEHVEVHGGEEGDVEEHDAEDDQGEGEGDVESIGKVDGEKVLLAAWLIFTQFQDISSISRFVNFMIVSQFQGRKPILDNLNIWSQFQDITLILTQKVTFQMDIVESANMKLSKMSLTVDHGKIGTKKFSSDSGRVGNDEEGVSDGVGL